MKQMTVQQFFKRFPDDESCLVYLFERRFGPDYACPKCEKKAGWYRIQAERAYSCGNCGHHLHPTVGTPFAKSRTSLQLWFYAMFLFTSSRHGVSGKELQRQLGVTYKTAWRMGHEIRKHMALVDDINLDKLTGHVEIDETAIGGVSNTGSGTGKLDKKFVVMGMLERNGDVVTKIVPSSKQADLLPHIKANVVDGATVTTDGLAAYKSLDDKGYDHLAVDHSDYEWAVGKHHTNSLEGYWSILKRSISSTHMHISEKHAPKYLDEFEYRHNHRKHPHLMFPQLIANYPDQED